MSDPKQPPLFDFGYWRGLEHCPRHGEVTDGLLLKSGTTVRRYCPLCVIDALDKTCTIFENTR